MARAVAMAIVMIVRGIPRNTFEIEYVASARLKMWRMVVDTACEIV